MSKDETQRLDKWLWCARFFKSRGRANKMVGAGQLRLSGKVVSKAHQRVRAGDVLTFPQGPHIRVVKVLFLAKRRGPSPEAQSLYDDLAPLGPVRKGRARRPCQSRPSAIPRWRPTKRDRRLIDHFRSVGE